MSDVKSLALLALRFANDYGMRRHKIEREGLAGMQFIPPFVVSLVKRTLSRSGERSEQKTNRECRITVLVGDVLILSPLETNQGGGKPGDERDQHTV